MRRVSVAPIPRHRRRRRKGRAWRGSLAVGLDPRRPVITLDELDRLHEASLVILARTGVVFDEPEARALLTRHGVRVDGVIARPDESDVARALESAPSHFVLESRNPDGPLRIGDGSRVLLPASGAPFVIDEGGRLRRATLEDHGNICRLVQTSHCLGMSSAFCVQPCDVDSATGHLPMLLNTALLCDRPNLAVTTNLRTTKDSLEMAALLWGGWKEIGDRRVTLGICNCRSPLHYGADQISSLLALARRRQPVIAASLVMAGLTGPMTLAGTLAVQNAEILAALVLSQCVQPGAPFVYGGISCVSDPRLGTLATGAPETAALISASLRLARYYGLPSRSGGALTDATASDAQAGIESTLTLAAALRGGADVVLHACGALASYNAFGFAKLVLDEDLCLLLGGPETIRVDDDTLCLDLIDRIGHGGHFLAEPETADACAKAIVLPRLLQRAHREGEDAARSGRLETLAQAAIRERLAAHESPDLDPAIVRRLRTYVEDHR